MNISDMVEFVNKISSFDIEKSQNEDGIAMSEIREDKVNECVFNMKTRVAVDKVEGV